MSFSIIDETYDNDNDNNSYTSGPYTSDLVQYSLSGFTPTRTLSSKIRDTISIFDFMTPEQINAVQTNLWSMYDVTTPITNAINFTSIQGCKLFFPPGRYKHTDITIDMLSSITIEGASPPHIGPGISGAMSTALIYIGSGNGITIKNSTGSQYTYRFNLMNISIWTSGNSPTVQSLIYCKNIQESMFYNVAVISSTENAVVKGIFFDSAGITHVDYCIVVGCQIGIDFVFSNTSNSNGGVSISRCNIFNNQVAISLGIHYFLYITNNWFEGFKTAILVENGNSKARAEAFGVVISNNEFLQSMSKFTDARFLRVSSTDNTKPIRLKLAFFKNWCGNTSGVVMPYAISFDTASCASIVRVKAEVEGNWIYGVSTAGIYSDSNVPLINYSDNEVQDAIDGNYVQQFYGNRNGGHPTRYIAFTTGQISSPSNTSENTLTTVNLPAYPGLNSSFKLFLFFSATSNVNTKIIRVRIGTSSGTIINQADMGTNSSSQLSMNTTITCRNSHSSQIETGDFILSGGVPGTWLNTTALNMGNPVLLYITVQKVNGTDSVNLETLSCLYLPS